MAILTEDEGQSDYQWTYNPELFPIKEGTEVIKGGKDRLDHVNEGPRYSYLVNFQLNRLYLDDVWCKAAVNL